MRRPEYASVEHDQSSSNGRSLLWARLVRDVRFWAAAVLLATLILMAVFPTLFTGQDPHICRLSMSLDPPEFRHPFGFDLQGCDYYARTVYGARTSLLIGVVVVAVAAVIGLVLGSIAGYSGGVVDGFVSRAADIWMAMPIVLGGLFLLSFIEKRGMVQVILVLTFFAWPAMVRLTRSTVMQVKESEFVLAAQALGASRTRILTRHIIPHSTRPLAVYSALFAGTAIAAEAILSYMGVGLQLPAISWGLMLAGIRHRLPGHPHLLMPGVFLTGAVLGLILLGDSLRSATDPDES